MSLWQQWEKFVQEKQKSPDNGRKYWKEYFDTEKSLYEKIRFSRWFRLRMASFTAISSSQSCSPPPPTWSIR